MSGISSTGWIIIIVFVFFIIMINVSLFAMGKNKNQKSGIEILRNSLQDPFQDEDRNLNELSKLAAALKENDPGLENKNKGEENAK
jgi:hypothetical protein